MSDTVNNYPCGVYSDGEVYIQTEPRQMQANGGKVYLTVRELRRLLAMLEKQEPPAGGERAEGSVGQAVGAARPRAQGGVSDPSSGLKRNV